MLIAGGHSQILVAKQLGHRVNVRALHSEPTCCRVPEVVEAEIFDSDDATGPREGHRNGFRRDALLGREYEVSGPSAWEGIERITCDAVEVDDSAFAVFRLWKQDTVALAVYVHPSQTQDLAPTHPEGLPREVVTHLSHRDCCPGCGGPLRQFGEDVSEQLEYIPESFKVIRHVRPKFACSGCQRVVEAPAPSRIPSSPEVRRSCNWRC